MRDGGFAKMRQEEGISIVGHLRTLTSINNEVPKRKLQISFHPTVNQVDLEKNVRPAFADRKLYGEYLVNMAASLYCPTPLEKSNLQMSKAFSVGQEFQRPAF